jgi:6-pyruvoyltetrahydropterin/6-carboxytetrahydropterin synthase
MHELSKQFRFEAAHTLPRLVAAEGSRRIHGHSYRAEVTLRGAPDPRSGMLVDLGLVEEVLKEVRDALDHQFLDEVAGLGPPTLENLASFIVRLTLTALPSLHRVTVFRDSTGESCALVVNSV